MPHVLKIEEQEGKHKELGRVWTGHVVVESGKRRLQIDDRITMLPRCQVVPLPGDVEIVDKKGKVVRLRSGRFFITVKTLGPHIVIEVPDEDDVPF